MILTVLVISVVLTIAEYPLFARGYNVHGFADHCALFIVHGVLMGSLYFAVIACIAIAFFA